VAALRPVAAEIRPVIAMNLLPPSPAGQNAAMVAAVFQVLLSLSLIVLLLYGVTWFEQRVLSPQSLIAHSVRTRAALPEHVEVLVAAQSKPLLAELVAAGDAEATPSATPS
jgi:hypothetical protein